MSRTVDSTGFTLMHDFLVLDVVLTLLLVAPFVASSSLSSSFLAVCYVTGSHFLFQCYLQYTVLSATLFFFAFFAFLSFFFWYLELIDFLSLSYSTTHRALTYFHSVLELCWYGVPYILLYMCCDHGSIYALSKSPYICISVKNCIPTSIVQSANFHPIHRRLTSERSEPLARRPKSRREKWAKYADSATFVFWALVSI